MQSQYCAMHYFNSVKKTVVNVLTVLNVNEELYNETLRFLEKI